MDQLYAYAIALQEHLVTLRHERDRLKQEGEFRRYERFAKIIIEIEEVLENLAPVLKRPTLH